MESSVCRFCAELKPIEKMYNLQTNLILNEEIQQKVNFLKAIYINLSHHETYPTALCFVCYNSLIQAFSFLKRVKRAQNVICDILANHSSSKVGCDGKSSASIKTEYYEEAPLNKEHVGQASSDIASCSDTEVIGGCREFEVQVDVEHKNFEDVKQEFKASVSCGLKWNEMLWLCHYCSMQFCEIKSLREHTMSVHNTCCAFKCPVCSSYSVTSNFNGFIRHMRKHFRSLRKCCIHCNKNFASLVIANAHSKKHLKNKYLCNNCGKIFKNETVLQEHLNLYSVRPTKTESQDIEGRTCNNSGKVFQSTARIPTDMMIHEERKKYTCDRCGKSFLRKGCLVTHLKSHSQAKKDFECKICNKSFTFRRNLIEHIERHSSEKKFKCEACGKQFKIRRQLKDHSLVHTDYMPFSCEVCAKRFRRKNNLRKHLLQHTGEKPYMCDECDKSFTDVGNRNKHMKRVHNKITVKHLLVIDEPTEELEQWKKALKRDKNKRKMS